MSLERGTLLAVWGGDRARPRLARPRALLGSDPDVVYALGERDDDVVLESWSALTGVRVGSVVVARAAQLRCREVWRADRADHAVIALRGLDRNEAALLDLRTGSLWEERGIDFRAHLLATSRDGRVFAAGWGADLGVVACVEGGRRVEREASLSSAAISPDGGLLARWVAGTDTIVVSEPAASGAPLGATAALAGAEPPRMAFAHDGSTLWALDPAALRAWEVPSMTPLGRWARPPRSADVVATDRTGRAALLDGPVAYAVGADEPVSPSSRRWVPRLARVSPDGTRLARASNVLGWHDLARDARVELHASGHAGAVRAIAVSADGSLVATAGDDRVIRVCGAVRGDGVWDFEGAAEGFEAVAFAPDGRALYAVAEGRPPTLTTWSLTDGVEVTPARVELPRGLGAVAVSADGARLLPVGMRTSRPWPVHVDLHRFALRTENGDEVVGSPGVFGEDVAMWWSLDRRRVVELEQGADGVTVVVYEAGDASRETLRLETRLREASCAPALGERLVALAGGGVVGVLDCATRDLVYLNDPLRTPVTSLALAPDGSALYVGTDHGQVRVYAL